MAYDRVTMHLGRGFTHQLPAWMSNGGCPSRQNMKMRERENVREELTVIHSVAIYMLPVPYACGMCLVNWSGASLGGGGFREGWCEAMRHGGCLLASFF